MGLAISENRKTMEHDIRDLKDRLGKKTVGTDWSFWGAPVGNFKLTTPYPKDGCKGVVTKNEGFTSGAYEQTKFGWDAAKKRTEWEVQCSAGWCRGFEFDLKLLVQSWVVYAQEI